MMKYHITILMVVIAYSTMCAQSHGATAYQAQYRIANYDTSYDPIVAQLYFNTQQSVFQYQLPKQSQITKDSITDNGFNHKKHDVAMSIHLSDGQNIYYTHQTTDTVYAVYRKHPVATGMIKLLKSTKDVVYQHKNDTQKIGSYHCQLATTIIDNR